MRGLLLEWGALAMIQRPIGIYEWCALTQEMLGITAGLHSERLRLLRTLSSCCFRYILDELPPDAIERGEKLLREREQP